MSSALTPVSKTVFSTIGICLSTTGLFLNILGIYGLAITKPRGNKQTILLINISIVSSCLCMLFIPSWTLWGLVSITSSKKIEELLFIAETGFYMTYVTSTFGLTIDRFLAVATPFKHRFYVNNTFVRSVIFTCWFIGQTTRIPFLILQYPKKLLHMVYFDVSINAINIIFQPVTYVYILVKWKQRKTQLHNSSKVTQASNTRASSLRTRDAKREASMLLTALMITISCLMSSICDIIYTAIGMSTPSSNNTLLSPIGLLLWNLVPTVQSIFYIATKPEIKQLFWKKLCCIEEGS